MDETYRLEIKNEFKKCVDGTIERIESGKQTYRPFHAALLSDDVLYWSAFERSFSTSFGQRTIEKLAEIVAHSDGAEEVKRQKQTYVTIDSGYEEAIHNHINKLRNNIPGYKHDWTSSLNEIMSAKQTGIKKEIRVISDIWWKKQGIDNFISLKTVKPNIDQTAVAKEDCLHLKLGIPNCNVYFGLPYNPYGEDRTSYKHNPPKQIFDMCSDPVVLIGKDMWDTIGGDGCYEELLEIAQEVGQETKEEIVLSRH